MGFARVKCMDCHHEYLLPFSCKRRHFCPSCHQKRVVEFGEFLQEEVLADVPHRQWVFSLPKRLRLYFLYDRKLLAGLSRCVWKVMSRYLEQGVSVDYPKPGWSQTASAARPCIPGVVIAVQTFGDMLNFNPHLHVIATDGCFDGEDEFMRGALPSASDIEPLFRLEVLKMLMRKGKITTSVIENMDSWYHSGFHVYCGGSMEADDQVGVERLARYIIRAPISQERMRYVPSDETFQGIAQVLYTGKNGGVQERFPAVDWLARLVTHIPNKGEQMVRYYGYYANKSRGLRKKSEIVQSSVEGEVYDSDGSDVDPSKGVGSAQGKRTNSGISKKKYRKNWARLIQKIYLADPLLCPKCNGKMRIIAFIEEEAVIRKILIHLDQWLPGNHDPPRQKGRGQGDASYQTMLSDSVFPDMISTFPNMISTFPVFSDTEHPDSSRDTKSDKSIDGSFTESCCQRSHKYASSLIPHEDAYLQIPYEDAYSQEVNYGDDGK